MGVIGNPYGRSAFAIDDPDGGGGDVPDVGPAEETTVASRESDSLSVVRPCRSECSRTARIGQIFSVLAIAIECNQPAAVIANTRCPISGMCEVALYESIE